MMTWRPIDGAAPSARALRVGARIDGAGGRRAGAVWPEGRAWQAAIDSRGRWEGTHGNGFRTRRQAMRAVEAVVRAMSDGR
jgi:hypothetical protein